MKKAKRKSEKATVHGAAKNRYARRSKLSEYQFLRVLRAFADNLTVKEASAQIRVSERSIRTLYRHLRAHLIAATLLEPFRFGGAGFYLFDQGRISRRGREMMRVVYTNENYRRHKQRHAPRWRKGRSEHDLVIEMVVRLYCSLHMEKTPENLYPDDTRAALAQLRDIGSWIRDNQDMPSFVEEHAATLKRFREVSANMMNLLEREALLSLTKNAAFHRFPASVLFEDLKASLKARPLDQSA